jgi:1-acyl-sn-glycerol-3-phosphate acyltransferase
MFYLRLAVAMLGFVAASVYGLAIALLRRDRSAVASDYARVLARLMCPPLGLRLTVHGRENLTAHRPCVFIGNHQSALDVPILASIFAPGSVVIAKKEVGAVPFFGWLYTSTGNLLIDRADTSQSVGRLHEAEEAIRDRRAAVWIFPEGTRGAGDGIMLPFKKGGFQMAVRTGAPLVPVVISPLKPNFDISTRTLRPGPVQIRVLDAISTDGLTEADIPALLETARGRMEAALGKGPSPGS